MKILIVTVCLLLLNGVAVSSAGANSGSLSNTNALTSKDISLSFEEMSSTRAGFAGQRICICNDAGCRCYVF